MKLLIGLVLFFYRVCGKVFPISWDPRSCIHTGCNVVKNYVSYINGTLNYTNCKNECEFGINTGIAHRYNSSFYFYEYNNIKIIQPSNPTPDREFYVFMPFHWKVWVLVFGSVFYLAAVVKFTAYLENACSAGWSKSFLTIVQTLFSAGATFRRTTVAASFLYFLIILYAFLINVMYPTFLESFFIIDVRKVTILCPKIYFANHNQNNYGLNFKLLSVQDYLNAFAAVNSSVGYCLTPPYRELIQKNVDHKFYRTDPTITIDLWAPIHYFQEKDRKLADSYEKFLGIVHSSGLISHWRFQQFLGYIFKGMANLSRESSEFTVLNLYEFKIPLLCLIAGLSSALMCFLVEICTFF